MPSRTHLPPSSSKLQWLILDSRELRQPWSSIGMLSLIQLLDDEKCFEVVRQLRWPDGVMCPHC
ncbi:transposase, partial [Deinococcus frigens]